MSKFKVGDKVRIVDNTCSHDLLLGSITTIIEVRGLENYYKSNWFIRDWDAELIDSNKNNMNIKEKFVSLFLSEPEKSFRKAGITNGDGMLTTDGQTIFLSYLLKKHGDDFKTSVVDELLKEEDK